MVLGKSNSQYFVSKVRVLWLQNPVSVFCFFFFFHNQTLLNKKVLIKEYCCLFVHGFFFLTSRSKQKISSIRKNILNQTTCGKDNEHIRTGRLRLTLVTAQGHYT